MLSILALVGLWTSVIAADPDAGASGWRYWPPGGVEGQKAYESALNKVPEARSLGHWHERATREPHIAGSEGDHRLAKELADAMKAMGLEVETQEIWPYLAYPVSGAVEVVTPEKISLPVKESAVAGDRFASREDVSIGWNAYSGSGEATGQVVYANYGTKSDFEKLVELGVDVKGKIVIARYGANYRGFKAKFAEAAGAAALIIFTDPADSGFVRGLMYPQGGFATPTYIQRGAIGTWNYEGDILTPNRPATKDADRLDPKTVPLPTIPVQPVGWQAANEILSRMKGPAVPRGWQGGLPFTYRVTGGEELTVRVAVQQERRLAQTYNVVGWLRGATYPDEMIVVGCHYDAWTFGAGDPHAGTMVVLEAAKSFAEAAKAGRRPDRTILFAHWGAEEYGVIGSVEWTEAHHERLSKFGVAYINLDMAVMGSRFGASASPSLKSLIAESTRDIAPSDPSDPPKSVFDVWLEDGADDLVPGHPRFGHLGGGSDHVGFYCNLCIPSAGLSSGGAMGIAYHSAYDNIDWYHKVVGDDYKPAVTMTQIVNTVTARLANGAVLPLDPTRYAPDFKGHLADIKSRADNAGLEFDVERSIRDTNDFAVKADAVMKLLFERVAEDRLSAEQYACVNQQILRLERLWASESGLPEREWFRNMFASTDPDSGYAAWMLPAFRYAIENGFPHGLVKAQVVQSRAFDRLEASLGAVQACWDVPASQVGE